VKMENQGSGAAMRLLSPTSSKVYASAGETGSVSSVAGYAPQRSGVARDQRMMPRNTRPVFVVGCPRSGTTLLQHMILSAGDFAFYPSESDTFAYLGARFPRLTSLKERKKALEFFLQTERFAGLGLERSDIEPRILKECRNIGDFLRILMEEMCRKQGVHRWVEKTPDHALYMSQIKRSIPESLIVHIIRDGRDVALSLAKYGVRRFLWQGESELLSFGALWKWMVRKARAAGRELGQDYYELHYEDLVAKPQETLAQLGEFIGHDLDYDRILKVGIGSVTRPYTSFPNAATGGDFNPVGRWKKQFSPEELARFEALDGDCLEEFGYPLSTPPRQRRRKLSTAALEVFYVSQLAAKQWIKSSTPLGRFVVRKRYKM
jgi:hypothetical protein